MPSLKRKLLVPLLLFGSTVSSLIVLDVYNRAEQALKSELSQRGTKLANMLNYAAESVSRAGELQRIVTAAGAEHDILEIIIVGGNPSRVLASTKNVWSGKLLSELPKKEFADDLSKAIQSRESHSHYAEEEGLFDVTVPLLLSQGAITSSTLSEGAVMVHLDTRSARALVRESTLRSSALFICAILILTAIGYVLLRKIVLRPIEIIDAAVKVGPEALEPLLTKIDLDDEIGALAGTLNRAVHDADASLHALGDQKFAMDQHAIVAVTDPTGMITYANDKFAEISKYDKTELVGQTHRLIKSEVHPPDFFASLWKCISGGKVWKGEICNLAKDGTLYWTDSTIVPLLGTKDKPQAYVTIQTDITARKETELALQRAKEAAETANRSKSEFLATMSHEIRTPMNGVIGFSDLLQATPLNAEQQQYTNTIKSSAEALLTIINDILDLSKIEASKLTIELLPLNLSTIIHDVTAILAEQARKKSVPILVDYPDTIPKEIVSDPIRVRQVLLNLVGNALKFTMQGSVSVRVKRVEVEQKAFLRLEVIDTGIGLSEEQQSRLFQNFSQADSSTTRRFGGTGLGLVICKRLVELMGGQIGIESKIDHGSVFWFHIPLLEVAHSLTSKAPQGAAQDVIQINWESIRVLVVEDNPVNQLLIMTFLKNFGCTVELAVNGIESLEHFQSRPYDLILMDCHLPEMDGFEATRRIRALESEGDVPRAKTPIIALTASAMKEDYDECIEAGMDDCLTKPLRVPILKETLLRVLGPKIS